MFVLMRSIQAGVYSSRTPCIGSGYDPLPTLLESIGTTLKDVCDNITTRLGALQLNTSSILSGSSSSSDKDNPQPSSCNSHPGLESLDAARQLYVKLWAGDTKQVCTACILRIQPPNTVTTRLTSLDFTFCFWLIINTAMWVGNAGPAMPLIGLLVL